ncbi:MAG: 4Fe-4S binding protein [Bacillota bacterium]
MGLYDNLPQRLKGWNRYIWIVLLIFISLGWFFPVIGLIALICMFAPVIIASVRGKRSWCVSFCPRGVFNDIVLKKLSRNDKIPRILHSKVVKIGFMIFLFYQFIIGIMNAGSIAGVGLVLVRIISLTTVITILLGVVFHPRSWCAFCPMGFLSNISIYIKRAWSLKNDDLEVNPE